MLGSSEAAGVENRMFTLGSQLFCLAYGGKLHSLQTTFNFEIDESTKAFGRPGAEFQNVRQLIRTRSLQ